MLRHMRIWQKLLAIAVAFSVPMGVLLYYFYDTAAYRRDFAQKEIHGNAMLQTLRHVLEASLEHRAAAARFDTDPTVAGAIHAQDERMEGLSTRDAA